METTIITDSDKESWEYTEEENIEAFRNEISGVKIPTKYLDEHRADVIAMGIERCLRDFKLDIKVKGEIIEFLKSSHLSLEFFKKKER